jgi:hypothetical protein
VQKCETLSEKEAQKAKRLGTWFKWKTAQLILEKWGITYQL